MILWYNNNINNTIINYTVPFVWRADRAIRFFTHNNNIIHLMHTRIIVNMACVEIVYEHIILAKQFIRS